MKWLALLLSCLSGIAAPIPAGPFQMGYTGDGSLFIHTVQVSAIKIDDTLVTWGTWKKVADDPNYKFSGRASGAGDQYPVQNVSWYDAVKWCNARSEAEKLTPCYTVKGQVYRTGNAIPICNYSASGYRLPTEAEWEKSAKGGFVSKMFPWGGDTVSHFNCNYTGDPIGFRYDKGQAGRDPRFSATRTSPVGFFPPNPYQLHDTAGNLGEWVWDWYSSGYYRVSPTVDPTGPLTGTQKIARGGSYTSFAPTLRCADRSVRNRPTTTSSAIGFRCVRR